MDGRQQASRCRQRLAEGLARLAQLTEVVKARSGMIRASLYRYRRRCGSPGCRCARGEEHEGRALSVSEGRRSRTVGMTGLDLAEVERHVNAYRQWRDARAGLVRSFGELLEAVDELARLRTVPLERLRRARGRRE